MLGYAHECETPNDELNEKEMDLHNNNGDKIFPKQSTVQTKFIFLRMLITITNL